MASLKFKVTTRGDEGTLEMDNDRLAGECTVTLRRSDGAGERQIAVHFSDVRDLRRFLEQALHVIPNW